MKRLPDNDWLLDAAGPGAVERGVGYYRKGRVSLTENTDVALWAEARGSETYALELAEDGAGWRWQCACPAADGGGFCKHLVAAVLVARDALVGAPSPETVQTRTRGARKGNRAVREASLLDFLMAQPVETLAGWLHELAQTDAGVERRLWLYRAADQPDELKAALGKLLNTGGFLDYRGAMRYAAQLDAGIAQLQTLLARDAAACRQLCEYALKRLIKVYVRADDSAGAIGERAGDIANLHRQACAAAPPGKPLAKALHELKCSDDWSLFPLDAYWRVLGADGQHDYANRVLAQFEALPPPTPADRYGEGFSVCRRTEELARCSDDFELLQRVLRRDLSDPWQHLRVFESLREAKRDREALAWVEQAAKRFPKDSRLHEALADSLADAGLDEEALAQAWRCFCEHPGGDAWRRLQRLAGPAAWPAWRQRALDTVSARERGALGLRIQLLQLDGDIDTAVALAREQPVASHVLAELASHVTRTHPADAGAFQLRLARGMATRMNGPSDYRRMVDCLRPAMRLLPAAQWQPFVDELRATHRRKPRLMGMLDEAVPR